MYMEEFMQCTDTCSNHVGCLESCTLDYAKNLENCPCQPNCIDGCPCNFYDCTDIPEARIVKFAYPGYCFFLI